ncbi:O-succinylbenzoic acid--CoA ligase [Microbacterium marinum]|uniref:O-succinylbenzoic acid--CoA ligase n=1 Tax=Microbacterium marinum TaxID=421115 RepID=A0A7W7BUV7_9MICO|nr:AMP-binding protein [Microbacterium marinum]MBB4668044.1 O-succinylbenzoic acid--CoA ligase [Microbacterium marinum]
MRDLITVGAEPRDVLRGLRATLDGAGPALALGDTEPPLRHVPGGTALVIATSGSSGIPKRVVLSRSALIASATATAARIGEGAWLLALPPTYIAGAQVLVRSLLAGHEPSLLAGAFSVGAFTAVAASMRSSVGGAPVPRFTSLVPTQLSDLVTAGEADAGVAAELRGFEAILVGGQALAPSLAERAAALDVRVVRTYGSSETSGGCVYDGVPLDGVGIRIVEGEVQLTGPMLADGYLGETDRTDDVFVRDGGGTRWYRTGDAGTFEGGIVRVTGRLDNVIVSGGVNVSLDRVEGIVRIQPGLDAAVVIPIEDARWGQASAVAITRDALAGRHVSDVLAELRDAVGEAAGAPARPRALLVLDEVPLLPSGKPDRGALRVLWGDREGAHRHGQ